MPAHSGASPRAPRVHPWHGIRGRVRRGTDAAVSTDADAELAAAIEQLKMENDELAKRLEFVKEATVEKVCPKPTLGRAVPGCAVPRWHTAPLCMPCALTERTELGGRNQVSSSRCVECRPFAYLRAYPRSECV
jgi:hypothetical protein